MNIILFSHPEFMPHQSMPRFTKMLAQGMREKGHFVEVYSPKPFFIKLAFIKVLRKWFGYVDQYIVFPFTLARLAATSNENTIFVFTDHALGPWVPIFRNKPHVIHCHDFLAQMSALGKIDYHRTSWTGKLYQKFIRRGFNKGKNFICISEKTRVDLHLILNRQPALSEMVYNGFNRKFFPAEYEITRDKISKHTGIDVKNGFLLHVGGNQWYKNRRGVLWLYDYFKKNTETNLPLLLIGEKPGEELLTLARSLNSADHIHFLYGCDDEFVQLAYSAATLLLYPSIAEGFGWPIIEAMASGCPVITTSTEPMTEVGGKAAVYIPPIPSEEKDIPAWSQNGARIIKTLTEQTAEERNVLIDRGYQNVRRFENQETIDKIEAIYSGICDRSFLIPDIKKKNERNLIPAKCN